MDKEAAKIRKVLKEVCESICWGPLSVDYLTEQLDGNEKLAQKAFDIITYKK